MRRKILYVEDEPSLGKIVSETLHNQGFDVVHVADGAKVMNALNGSIPDICVVDIMLPNVDGFTLCEQIKRRHPAMPVIFLTAKTDTTDLVKGFEAGGTDYVRKPFSMEELIVRINNQLALAVKLPVEHEPMQVVSIGNFRYHPVRYELETPTKTIKLSQREQEVLTTLLGNINRAVDRKHILLSIWGDDSYFNSRNLDVYIRKLRDYFSEDPRVEIVTLKGKGYLFLVKS